MSYLRLTDKKTIATPLTVAVSPILPASIANGFIELGTAGNAVVATLPAISALNTLYGNALGMTVIVKRNGAGFLGSITANATGANTIDGVAAGVNVDLPLDNDSLTLMVGSATNWEII